MIWALLACGTPQPASVGGDSAQATADSGGDSGVEDSATDPSFTGIPLTDEDGDGYISRATGGDDCDDADPNTHPGATDWCDGKDQDCDGDPVGAGMCTEGSDVAALDGIWWWPEPPFSDYLFEAVWHTSGGDALVAATVRQVESTGIEGVLPYLSVAAGEQPSGGPWWDCTADYDCARGIVDVGDFDGDGADELLMGGPGWSHWTPAVFLLSGDTATWPAPGSPMPDAAAASWVGGDQFATSMSGGADLNGDGLSDFIVYDPGVGGGDGDYRGSLSLMLGRSGALPALGDAGDEVVFHHQDIGNDENPLDDAFDKFEVALDIDGDGDGDLIAGGYEEGVDFLWASGTDLAGEDGAYLVDVFDHTAYTGTGLWLADGGGGIGDLDGDGINDILVDSQDGANFGVSVLSGSALANGLDGPQTVLTEVRGLPDMGMNLESLSYDVDGDSVLDPVYGAPNFADDSRACVFATSMLPIGGVVDSADVGPCFDGRTLLADVDDDGIPEFHIYGGDGVLEVLSLPEFSVPWGDPTKW